MQAIVARAEGNPFFLEELARAVGEHDATQVRPSPVPETVQAVLAARIDRLPAGTKHLLQVAAVIGKDVTLPCSMPWPASAAATGAWPQRLQAPSSLMRRACSRTGVHFPAHPRPGGGLSVLARRTAAAAPSADHDGWLSAFLRPWRRTPSCWHITTPRRAYGAGHCLLAAGRAAGPPALSQPGSPQHLTKGLELLATLPDTPARAQQELDLQMALGPALMATKGYAAPEVEQTYARARELCAQVGETPQLFPALRGLCRSIMPGGVADGVGAGEQLMRLAQRAAALTLRLEAHKRSGALCSILGEYAAARTHLEQGIALTDPAAQRTRRSAMAWRRRCSALPYGHHAVVPGLSGAGPAAESGGLALAQALAHPQSLAVAQHFAATCITAAVRRRRSRRRPTPSWPWRPRRGFRSG